MDLLLAIGKLPSKHLYLPLKSAWSELVIGGHNRYENTARPPLELRVSETSNVGVESAWKLLMKN